jgi:hypothetical protein
MRRHQALRNSVQPFFLGALVMFCSAALRSFTSPEQPQPLGIFYFFVFVDTET